MTTRERPRVTAEQSWEEVSRFSLELHLNRLRLYLKRRVLWLRKEWADDPGPTYQGMVIGDAEVDRALREGSREAEAHFYREDPKASAITERIRRAETQLSNSRIDEADDAPIPAIDILVGLFGLTRLERDVLLLCAAPGIDPAFERLYAYVQDSVQRPYATPDLASTLFQEREGAEGSVRDALQPEAPLRRFRLVSAETGHAPTPSSLVPLRVDDRVTDFLSGTNRLDERASHLVRELPHVPLAPIHEELSRQATQALLQHDDGLPILNLIGGNDSGKESITRALCERLGLQPLVLDWSRLPAGGPDLEDATRLLAREAMLSRICFFLEEPVQHPDGATSASLFKAVIEQLDAFLVASSSVGIRTERPTLPVRVPKPDASCQQRMWERALGSVRHSLNGQTAAVVQQFDFGPIAIGQSVVAARNLASLRNETEEEAVTADDIWRACRDRASMDVDTLARRIVPCYTWNDIVLPHDVRLQLEEIAAQVAHRAHVYETWGFGAKLSRGRGISALFSGPSGTGKTMAAEILAEHLDLDLYRIDLAGVVSKYIGETEKNLKSVFDAAERSGAILFFDEADALFGKRTEVKDSHDRYANIEVNYLLQRMEDYRGLAVLSTNRRSSLDRAFLRRLRFVVEFPFPDGANRTLIWKKVFPPEADLGDVDFGKLARLEVSGGNIRNIALNAAFLAAGEGTAIGMAHVLRAARREYTKIGKMMTDLEFGSSSTGVTQ